MTPDNRTETFYCPLVMPENNPNDFTDREKFILHYFLSDETSMRGRRLIYQGTIILASIGCVIFAALREDIALGFVAYMLILVRLCYMIVEGGRYSEDLRSIFMKYEAKLKASADAPKAEKP